MRYLAKLLLPKLLLMMKVKINNQNKQIYNKNLKKMMILTASFYKQKIKFKR